MKRIRTIALALLSLGLATTACEKTTVRETRPIVTVTLEGQAAECDLSTDCILDFGEVYVGNTSELDVVVGNNGDGNLALSAIAFDPQVEHYSLPDPSLDQVGPGQALPIAVAYSPQAEGEHTTDLLITSDDPDHPVAVVSLVGASRLAPMPQLVVCVREDPTDPGSEPTDCVPPHGIDYGNTALVPLGDPVPTPVVLKNMGEEPLILHSVFPTSGTTSEFTFDPDPTGTTLEPIAADGTADQVELTLWYTPVDGGEDDGFLQVNSNDPDDRETQVHLLGRGIAPRICSDPLKLEFGSVAIGFTAVRSFAISNCGLEIPLRIGTIGFHDQSSDEFAFTALPLTPFELIPGEQIEIEVAYTPTDTGPDGARVVMQSNDPAAESGYILLQGEGSDEPICDLDVTPVRLNFGMIPAGETESRNLSVRNLGSAECHITDITEPQGEGEAAYQFSSLPLIPFSLGPGDQQNLTVRYGPQDQGPHRASVTITSDDYEMPENTVDLYGNDPDVPECNLQVVPTQINFGTVALWRTTLLEVTVDNIGAEPCVVASLDFMPGSDPAFTLAEAPSLPAQIPAHSSTTVLLGYTPIERRLYSGSLSIVSDDPDSPVQTVTLSGSGEELNLMVIPDNLDFGYVTLGCSSPDLTVTVYNIGSTSVEITDVYLDALGTDPEFSMIALDHGGLTAPPFTLSSADSFRITLRYIPQALVANNGILVIESSAAIGAYMEVSMVGNGTDIADQTDLFNQLDNPMVDVLFVIDNSGSMSPYQQALASNFSTFINWAITLDTDFQIGVISTEINEPETPADFFNIYPGILCFYPGFPKIITNDTPNLVQAFSKNVNIGTCCSDEQESGLHATMLALSEPLVSATAANGGFVREDAKLVIIMVSDEPDQSPAPVDFYVDFFGSIKGYRNDQLMDVSVIVESGSDARYAFAQEATGGLYRSLDSNWGNTLSDLGLDAFAARTQFPLSRPANPLTIVVAVDENDGQGLQPIPYDDDESGDGFIYDTPSNSIVFGDDVVPGRGATIQVAYETICL